MDSNMPIMLKKISLQMCLLCVFITYASPSIAMDLTLPVSQDTRISMSVRNNRVTANDVEKNIAYRVDSSISAHMKKADEIQLLDYKSNTKNPLFIILSREPSRLGRMGMGYCGAGYEDYLLLVEPGNRKIVLRDKLLLQSCLEGKLIYNDAGGDDITKLLIPGKNNSFHFRWESDDDNRQRNLTVRNGRFLMPLVDSGEN
jgi:hypothetical protein